MLFTSATFFLFFIIVFYVYWFVLDKNFRWQNLFLWIASYVFYGWWDWRFLFLLFLSSSVDFVLGLKMKANPGQKIYLYFSLIFNLGMLGFFKYFNFFSESFAALFANFGVQVDPFVLKVILPVGISFYTFQSLSYTIDVYKKQMEPTTDFIQMMAFVSFFPQLVAGPIERAKYLLPQFAKIREFKYEKAIDGSRQILWGFFKKMVIADNCAPLVNDIFADPSSQSSLMLIIGAVLFAFQIYGDFSGYSDIALGVARLLGFDLKKNFNFPYFSTSMSEMWRKWHISLSSWANDYIFTPITKSTGKYGRNGIVTALICTFLVLGLWHGANWTFVFFGLLHGLTVASEYFFQKQIRQKNKFINNKFITSISGWLLTITLWLVGMIFFRAQSVSQAFSYFKGIFSAEFFPKSPVGWSSFYLAFFFIAVLLLIEWFNRTKEFGFEISHVKSKPLRWAFYFILLFTILGNAGSQQDFIYFQF